MDVEHTSNDPEVVKISSALNEVIRFRGITLQELAAKCGIEPEVLNLYTVTSLDLREARAIDLINLAEALNVDPYILVGKKPISEFKDQAQKEKIDDASLDFLRKMLAKPIG